MCCLCELNLIWFDLMNDARVIILHTSSINSNLTSWYAASVNRSQPTRTRIAITWGDLQFSAADRSRSRKKQWMTTVSTEPDNMNKVPWIITVNLSASFSLAAGNSNIIVYRDPSWISIYLCLFCRCSRGHYPHLIQTSAVSLTVFFSDFLAAQIYN